MIANAKIVGLLEIYQKMFMDPKNFPLWMREHGSKLRKLNKWSENEYYSRLLDWLRRGG